MPNEDWKEITLSQLLGASSPNPDPCDCSLHRLGEFPIMPYETFLKGMAARETREYRTNEERG